jgi:hypothetical protein
MSMKGTHPLVLAVLLTTACSDGAMAQDPSTLAASASGVITLGAGPTEVTLAGASEGGAPVPVAVRLTNVEPGRQIYLTFTRAQASSAPGVTYNIYLGLPASTVPRGTSDRHYVGTLNFFNATGRPLDMSLNITPQIGRLLASSEIGDDIRVTIVPAGEPAAAAQVDGIRMTAR